MKSETDDGLSSYSNFPERPSSYELESDKPVLPEIEHLKGKIGEGDFEKLRDLLNRNADVFSKHKADIGCCNWHSANGQYRAVELLPEGSKQAHHH